MSAPARPTWKPQGPASRCKLDNKLFGWLNCTPCAFAAATQKATLGRINLTGCDFRRSTGDRYGGTTLGQNATVARNLGVAVELHASNDAATPRELAVALEGGRGAVVQGSTGALINFPQRSTGGPINHAVYVNEGRGWRVGAAGYREPTDVLVYDPAADGRLASWGKADQGPSWWPWKLLLRFAALLQPWGEQDPRRLGTGLLYAAFFADTEPHAHLRFTGSTATSPQPRRLTVRSPQAGRRVNVRSGPSTSYGIVTTLATGKTFIAYQQNARGQELSGSRLWYGDHDGQRWVHSSGLR